jgi:Tol biopolymer transport system component
LQLERGTRLGVYEVGELLGSGGMGEVYRARDPRLDRSIAIKVLSAQRSATRESVARFEREARAASALNHPHILHVYDVGFTTLPDESEVHYIAMELIDGETLRRKFERRVPFRELLEPLIDVAEALAKAHAAGIIHRDLKPENIMITRDGYAKVLDFGLAKLASDSASPVSATEARTAAGVVLGTIGYMSPEQVEGGPVDERTDIYSFGCILYEAVSGTRAFRGPATVPHASPELQRIIGKCLMRDPSQRYQNIKDVAVDLRRVQRSPARPRRAWIYAALAVIALTAAIVLLPRPQPSVPPAVHQPFSSIDIERVTFTGDVAWCAISRSGRYLAYSRGAGQRSLWLKQFATGTDVQLVPPSQLTIGDLAFSPDENYVYFIAHDNLYRIPAIGGSPQRIVRDVSRGMTFAPDGHRMAYVRGPSNVMSADLDGSDEQTIYASRLGLIASPAWSPRGDVIVCTALTEKAPSLAVIDVRRHSLTVLRESRGIHVWMPDGSAMIAPKVLPEPTQQLRYVPYPRGKERRITSDLNNYIGASLTADGRTIASVQSQVARSIWLLARGSMAEKPLTPTVMGTSDGIGMTWTRDGALVYFSVDREIHLKILKPRESQPKTLLSEPYDRIVIASPPSVSPDDRRIAYASHVDGAIWVIDRDGGNRRRVTDGTADLAPQWLDDRTIIFESNRRVGAINAMFVVNGVWKVSVDGGRPVLLDSLGDKVRVSPDRRHLLLRRLGNPPALLVVDPDLGHQKEIVLPKNAQFRSDIWWSPDGRAIDYLDADDRLWRHPLDGGRPVNLTRERYEYWAWSPDGSQLAATHVTDSEDVVLIHDRERR